MREETSTAEEKVTTAQMEHQEKDRISDHRKLLSKLSFDSLWEQVEVQESNHRDNVTDSTDDANATNDNRYQDPPPQ